MRLAEYHVMADVEDSHWWYVAQRAAMRSLLERSGLLKSLHGGAVLDAGCGTGGHLKWLRAVLEPRKLAGFDRRPEAIRVAIRKVPEAQVWCDDLTCLSASVLSDSFDLILCSDVIYSLEQSAVLTSLQSLLKLLRPGGAFLLHVPALSWLYSHHDVSVGTQHRYRRNEVETLLKDLGLDIASLSYRVSVLFPLIVLQRLPSLLSLRLKRHREAVGAGGSRVCADERPSQLRQPPVLVNSLLKTVMTCESWWLGSGRTFPVGSSLVALGRKP